MCFRKENGLVIPRFLLSFDWAGDGEIKSFPSGISMAPCSAIIARLQRNACVRELLLLQVALWPNG